MLSWEAGLKGDEYDSNLYYKVSDACLTAEGKNAYMLNYHSNLKPLQASVYRVQIQNPVKSEDIFSDFNRHWLYAKSCSQFIQESNKGDGQ